MDWDATLLVHNAICPNMDVCLIKISNGKGYQPFPFMLMTHGYLGV